MRRTIHLCQRGLPAPLCCIACGEVAQEAQRPPLPQRQPAICYNRSDWDTIYRNHVEYRRCIDDPDKRDAPKLVRFPTPDRPGYYWAEWRIVEEGSFPESKHWEDEPVPGLCVVEVWSNDGVGGDLWADVPGVDVRQPLDNFVWRSARLEEPK